MAEHSKHTPGPWRASGYEIVGAEGTPDGYVVCRMTYGSASMAPLAGFGMPRSEAPKVRANAHLIAAAPDLLRIARAVVDGYAALDFDLQSWAREAAEAVAKAEGRS